MSTVFNYTCWQIVKLKTVIPRYIGPRIIPFCKHISPSLLPNLIPSLIPEEIPEEIPADIEQRLSEKLSCTELNTEYRELYREFAWFETSGEISDETDETDEFVSE